MKSARTPGSVETKEENKKDSRRSWEQIRKSERCMESQILSRKVRKRVEMPERENDIILLQKLEVTAVGKTIGADNLYEGVGRKDSELKGL
jgi:hypothetical protein